MTEQSGPVEVISLSEFFQRTEQGQPIPPGTLLLLPVQFWQQYEDRWQAYRECVEQIFTGLHVEQAELSAEVLVEPEAAPVYEHTLYFSTREQAEEARETLLTRRPRVVEYLSIEVRDLSGDPALDLYTREQLDGRLRRLIEDAVRPAYAKFNTEASTPERAAR